MDGTIYYYMTFIIVFQWGWAFVQLSHLSLIPCLGETDREREDLNSKRYGMMNVAFMGVYVISFIKFRQVTDCTINEQTAPHFSTITYGWVRNFDIMKNSEFMKTIDVNTKFR